MEHVRLGHTGLRVSRLCLGTMTFGVRCDEETSVAIIDRAVEAGITFFDTADVYPLGGGLEDAGRTEEILGRWLRGRRDQFVVATKCSGRTGPRPWQQGNGRQHIMAAVDASLRRLDTDYIDLYQLHFPDEHTPIDETLQTLDDLVRSGKVRYLGCSNFLAYQIARALGRSEALGLHRFATVQPRYNLLFREPERELLRLCAEDGLGVLPYNPLAGGLLTGRYQAADPPPDGRFGPNDTGLMYRDRYWDDLRFRAVSTITKLAADAGIQPATLAVAWVLGNKVVTAPIIGASSPGQLEPVLAALTTELDPDLRARLDRATTLFRWGDSPR